MEKLSRRRAEGVARWGILVHLVFAVVTFLLGIWNGAASNFVLAWLIAAGIPFWLLCLLHLRQQRLAEQEEVDWQRLLADRQAGGGRGALFEVEEGEAFLMRNRLRSLERIWLPVGSILLVLGLGGFCYLFLSYLVKARMEIVVENTLLSAGFLAVEAFLCFVIGMYAGGMAKEAVWRPLRAGASYMMFCAAGTALVIISLLLAKGGFAIDRYFAGVLAAALGVLAFEILLNFVVNIYRPRAPGVEVRYAYDSRLLELVSSPGSILRTVAATLDYQFGLKVSETWFYHFLERAIAPILLFDFVAFYLLTCLVVVGPEQRVIIERFGNASREGRVVGPGMHAKWPWPVERAYRFPARRVNALTIGVRGEDPRADRLWTVKHFAEEYNVLVATAPEAATAVRPEPGREAPPPVNLLVCNLVVHYRVKDDDQALYNYLYNVRDADNLLEVIVYREMTKYMASVDFFRVMCADRDLVGRELRARIQAAADATPAPPGLGLEILFVGLQGVHPPVEEEVGRNFEDVVAAQEEKQTMKLRAEADATESLNLARRDANVEVASAIGYRYQRGVVTQAEAERFEKQLAAYRKAPGVFEVRERLDNLEDVLTKVRKYVVAAKDWRTEIVRLNLEEGQRPSILDVQVPGTKQGTEKKGSD